MGNTLSLFSVEVMYPADEWHSCLHTATFFYCAYQWLWSAAHSVYYFMLLKECCDDYPNVMGTNDK
jgi:hypothetical protein